MRGPLLFLVAATFLSGGCSVYVAQSGTDLSRFKTRDQVHEHFGTPESTATPKNSVATEEVYVTRQKIATDEMAQMADNPAYFLTLGLYEFYALPRELFYLTKRTAAGQELRFTFDAAGNTIGIQRDGEGMHWLKFLGPDDNRRIAPVQHTEPTKR